MKGIEVYGMTYWSNTIRNLDKASLTLMDEILDLVKSIEAKDDESPRYLWITEQRGTLAEYKKCKNYNDEIRTKKDFQAYFPYEKIWLEFCGLHNRYAKLICINKLRFEIDTREDYVQDSFCYDFTEILTWLKEKIEATIQEIKEGTYNDKVWNELPYEYRYGTISRKVYYDHFPEAREEDFNGITEEEKQRFLQIVANENRNITERFKDMTFNKYFEMVYPCYVAMGKNVSKSAKETFFAYGEDFGGNVLEKFTDYNSTQDFDDWVDGKKRGMGGHAWGIWRGSSRHRIMLFPRKTDEGYYFQYSGNPHWNIYCTIKCYLALKDNGVPVQYTYPSETINYIKEEDLLGFVSSDDVPVYCQLSFPRKVVNEFLHYEEKHHKIFDLIDWEPIKEVKLKK